MDERMSGAIRALEEGKMSRAQFVRRGIGAGLSLTAISGLLAACGDSGGGSTGATTAAKPTSKPPSTPTGTLVLGNAEPPTAKYWDPAAGFGLVDEQVSSLVHESLMRYNADNVVVPSLATSADRVDDRTIRVTLREGVMFSNGQPVTGEDVAATFNRLGKTGSKLAQANTVPPLEAKVNSDGTIDIVTEKPTGLVESAIAYHKILPKSDIDNPDNFKQRALGAGPYKFVSYQGNTVTLEANEGFWDKGKGPHIKTIRLDYIADTAARMNALLTGDLHILSRMGVAELQRVENNKDYFVTKVSPVAEIRILWQHNRALKDLKVRQAVAYAIDRETISKSIMGGLNPVMYSFIPTNHPDYAELEPRYQYDPEKAKALVAEVGGKITLSQSTSDLIPRQADVDAAIVDYLNEVGITVEQDKLEAGAFRTKWPTYDMGTLTGGPSFTGDMDFDFQFFKAPLSKAIFQYEDAKMDQLVDAQRFALGDERKQKIQEAAQYAWEQLKVLPLTDEVWAFIVSSKVENYKRAKVVGERLLSEAWLKA